MAEAQASTESSTASSILDPTDSTGSADSTASASSSDLLGGGDSQLLTALQSMESGSSTGSTSSSDSASELSALESLYGASLGTGVDRDTEHDRRRHHESRGHRSRGDAGDRNDQQRLRALRR